MVKKVLIFGIIILLLLMGILYLFPCSANVESVKIYSLNNNTEVLNYWLKEGKWNFNPQKKYLRLFYTVSVHPHLPFSFQFTEITFKLLRDDFSVILLQPTIPHCEEVGRFSFKKRFLYFDLIVESPKDMNPRTIISNTDFKLHAYRWVKNPEWEKNPVHTSFELSYPSWPILRVEVPKNLSIDEVH